MDVRPAIRPSESGSRRRPATVAFGRKVPPLRPGSRLVMKAAIARQSNTGGVGRTTAQAVRMQKSTRSSARSRKSVCGNSLKATTTSAASTIALVRQRESVSLRAPAGSHHGCRAEGRSLGMRAGRAVERRLERRAVHEKGGEGVRLDCERGHEYPHQNSLAFRCAPFPQDRGNFYMANVRE
jgi:hypothetical protein